MKKLKLTQRHLQDNKNKKEIFFLNFCGRSRSGGPGCPSPCRRDPAAAVAAPGEDDLVEILGGAVLHVAGLTLFVLVLAGLAAGVLSLLLFHLHLVAQNLTTLESMKGLRHAGNGGAPRVDNIYDLGLSANVAQVFGDSPTEWFLWTPVGDGLSFPTRIAPLLV